MNRKRLALTYTVRQGLLSALSPSLRMLPIAVLVGALLLLAGSGSGQEKPSGNDTPPVEPAADPRLLNVKRICFENFGDDLLGKQVKEMIIAGLFEAKRFSLTENCERADYVMKGSVTQRIEHVSRSESEGVSAGREAAGASASSSSVSVGAVGGSLSAHESLSSSQTKEYAVVTLRVVDKNAGDILWAFSQESSGAKTKGAIGDAAERAVRRFLRDLERAEKQSPKQEKRNKP